MGCETSGGCTEGSSGDMAADVGAGSGAGSVRAGGAGTGARTRTGSGTGTNLRAPTGVEFIGSDNCGGSETGFGEVAGAVVGIVVAVGAVGAVVGGVRGVDGVGSLLLLVGAVTIVEDFCSACCETGFGEVTDTVGGAGTTTLGAAGAGGRRAAAELVNGSCS
jgi:hypothetical protein